MQASNHMKPCVCLPNKSCSCRIDPASPVRKTSFEQDEETKDSVRRETYARENRHSRFGNVMNSVLSSSNRRNTTAGSRSVSPSNSMLQNEIENGMGDLPCFGMKSSMGQALEGSKINTYNAVKVAEVEDMKSEEFSDDDEDAHEAAAH